MGRKIAYLEKRLQWLEWQRELRDNDIEIMETKRALNVWLDAKSNVESKV